MRLGAYKFHFFYKVLHIYHYITSVQVIYNIPSLSPAFLSEDVSVFTKKDKIKSLLFLTFINSITYFRHYEMFKI